MYPRKMIRLFLVLSLLCVSSHADPFEVLKLMHMWGKSFCKQSRVQCYSGRTLQNKFTIHGLFPLNRTQWLTNCAQYPYIYETNRTLVGELLKEWPDLERPDWRTDKFQDFWKHEWDKHGTCMAPGISQSGYFQLTLRVKGTIDFLTELSKRGIVPGNVPNGVSYTFSQINTTVSQVLGGKVADIGCSFTSTGGRTVCELLEIGVCYDPNMAAIIDCPVAPNVPRSDRCSQSCSARIFFRL